MVASVDEDATDSLPDRSCSKEFYAKYEPKDVLGRYVVIPVNKLFFSGFSHRIIFLCLYTCIMQIV
jgi:hypothetical protein